MTKVIMNENGWTCLQESDPEKHVLEVSCRAENGVVVEVRFRHNDGEEQFAKVTLNGKDALPMAVEEFAKHFEQKHFEFK